MDFIKVEYTGYAEGSNIFDSTSGEIAKTLHGREGALLIIFKVDALPKGLEETIQQMNKGEEREATLAPDKAFGKPKRSLMKVFSASYFKSQNIKPQPGLAVYLDTDKGRMFGTVKSVNSGRVVVDLNHPLAGKKVSYKIKLVDVITATEERIKELLIRYNLEGKVVLNSENLTLELRKPTQNKEQYEQGKVQLLVLIKRLFKDVKNVNVNETA